MTDSTGKSIWTSGTSSAVAKLQRHVNSGCLSHIPPNSGTNPNERFHRFLNSFFNKSKIGVILAYALMTLLIHAHNSQLLINGRRITNPISFDIFSHASVYGSWRPMAIVGKSYQHEEEDEYLGD